ncbi:hypothetical protein CYIG_00057 [Cyanophage NATL1A-7]|uniref:Predicted protein n=1 Tax=Cyanophage NATL1A-7 TaxID=445693 RepID=E3SNC6_9CAUD|nr:hypothetical protein CYIG_00057 [Cyanophage NATL1A-7]ADP00130.1 predicted protein [Cyanophage NATL1A-7]
MGLLDGTLEQKIKRLEKLTSPNQYGKGTKQLNDAIDKLQRNIRMSADASKAKKKKPAKRIKKSDLKKRYA